MLGHEWNTLISTRAGGSQCPYCSGIKLLKGFNDLKTKYPSLAAEWSEKNLSLTPDAVNEKSTKNVWWKCRTCGYEWKAVVKARVKGGMCPVCAERAVLQGYNDLGTTDPHLLSEWDFEKNSKWTPSNVSRNSMKVVWWKCGAGHSYRAKITDRTIEQKGCPQCEAEFQRALPQMLIMMYGAQNGITVKSNSDSELGMRLVAYLPELHCAVDIAGATVTEKREQSVKAHICQSNRLGYYLIKRSADTSQMAAEIKTLFIRNHIYLHTDSEKDVQVLRERFLEWKNRNACKKVLIRRTIFDEYLRQQYRIEQTESSLAIDGKEASTRQGTLVLDTDSGRVNIRFGLNDYYGFLSCGTRMEVRVDGEWIPTRLEMADNWILIGIETKDITGLTVRIKKRCSNKCNYA